MTAPAQFTQRFMARPKEHLSPEEILERRGSELTERLQQISFIKPEDKPEELKWSSPWKYRSEGQGGCPENIRELDGQEKHHLDRWVKAGQRKGGSSSGLMAGAVGGTTATGRPEHGETMPEQKD